MEAKEIWVTLQRDPGLGEAAARQEFLKWVLGLPEGVSPSDAAAGVLDDLPDGAQTRSAKVFRDCLIACTWPVQLRRRGRRRLLH